MDFRFSNFAMEYLRENEIVRKTVFTDAHIKRPKTKRPKTKCPRNKASQGTKRSKGQKVPGTKRSRDKTSQGTKRPKGRNEAHYLTWCGQLPNLIWPG